MPNIKKQKTTMEKTILLTFSIIFSLVAMAQRSQGEEKQQMRYGSKFLGRVNDDFFLTEDAKRIGDQVLLWQRNTGGWPKNIDMASPMSDKQKADVLADKDRTDDSTIDNNATTMQMKYLARLYQATKEQRYREGFRKGVEYLLSGQYKNGGWPQFWPKQRDYQIHITYNDDAMVNTMEMLRDMYVGKSPYGGDLCNAALKKKLITAFNKGVDCILNTQIVSEHSGILTKNGKGLTVWCQQHDRETLLPAKARAYELPSYCTMESAKIVKLLMEIPNPDKRIKAAVHAAMAWFDKYKLTGLEYKRENAAGEWQASVVSNPNASTPIWGRFYDLENCTPYVCDRDGIPRRKLEDIGTERRNGYAWYGSHPAELYPLYEEWAEKYDAKNKVNISLKTKGANENGTIVLGVQPTVKKSLFDVVVKRGESIQAAIEKAPENGTKPFCILVEKGIYNEKVIIDKPHIVLVGEQRDSCIIVGAEAQGTFMVRQYKGNNVHQGIVCITAQGNDCIISGLTVINNYGTTVTNTTTHQFAVYGSATRTIIINSNIVSDGNDALSLWGKDEDGSRGMYYHSDLYIRCPGVDFICPRGTCYATRCKFVGDTRAILWHDGRGDKRNKFVITNSEFDAIKPTPLGRYHHDSQFYIVNCHMSKNIIDADIDHAYKAQPELANGKQIDPCPWGHRVYYYGCTREGGHSGWLNNNISTAPDSPTYYSANAQWTFDGKWDPEETIRELWDLLAY